MNDPEVVSTYLKTKQKVEQSGFDLQVNGSFFGIYDPKSCAYFIKGCTDIKEVDRFIDGYVLGTHKTKRHHKS